MWSGDGSEIFYRALDGRLMAIPVSITRDGITAAAPIALFTMRPGATVKADRSGQRFLVNTASEDEATPPITVVLNWKAPAQ